MTVETATYIADLNTTYPTGTETNDSAEGDNHIRLIKTVLKATFPNLTGSVTATQTELNSISGITASVAELNIMDGVTITTSEINRLSGVTSAIQTQINAKMSDMNTTSVQTNHFNVTVGIHYLLRTNSAKTATMPASPTAGQIVWFTNHSGGDWTLNRNGKPIMGAAADDTMATDNHYEYQYIDDTTGWARLRAS